MDNYVGVKTVTGAESTYGDYKKLYPKRELNENIDTLADGYLVTYENGYQAWSPKNVFEETYRKLIPVNLKQLENDIRKPYIDNSIQAIGFAEEALKKYNDTLEVMDRNKASTMVATLLVTIPLCDVLCKKIHEETGLINLYLKNKNEEWLHYTTLPIEYLQYLSDVVECDDEPTVTTQVDIDELIEIMRNNTK